MPLRAKYCDDLAYRRMYEKTPDDDNEIMLFDQWIEEHDRLIRQAAWNEGYAAANDDNAMGRRTYQFQERNPYNKTEQKGLTIS